MSQSDFTAYFAAGSKQQVQLLRSAGVTDMLLSFAMFKKGIPDEAKGCKILLDSGAFSNIKNPGCVKIEEYEEFLKSERKKVYEYITFDLVHNPTVTCKNDERLRNAGFDPLFVDQLCHSAKTNAYTQKMYASGKKICWAGFVRPYSDRLNQKKAIMPGTSPEMLGRCRGRHPYLTKNTPTKLHLLGVGRRLQKFVEFWPQVDSFDATSWAINPQCFGLCLHLSYNKDGWPQTSCSHYSKPSREVQAMASQYKLNMADRDDRTRLCVFTFKKYYKALRKRMDQAMREGEHQCAEKSTKTWVDFGRVDKLSVDAINPTSLKQETDRELLSLHLRLHQLFGQHFANNSRISAGGLNRENLVNAELFTQAELARRNFEHNSTDELTEEADALRAKKEFAPVNPGGDAAHQGDPAKLDEVLSHFDKPMALRMPAVYLVGSTANHGESSNDIDLLVRGPFDDQTLRALQFRLGRALPPRLSERVQFHDDSFGGPFTHHVPLYDLVLVPHKDRRVVEMQDVRKANDPLLDLPPPGTGPQPAVLQYHFRGKSLHLDMRLKVEDYLVGWTIANQRAGVVPDVNTIAEAKRVAAGFSPNGSRYTKPFRAPSKLYAAPKSRQPLEWLKIKERVFPPGEVGATREEDGVMLAVDTPMVEFGMQKPFSHEYFFSKGKHIAGIWNFRMLVGQKSPRSLGEDNDGKTPAGNTFWVSWLSKELLPSVLKRRAVKTKTMPPDGYSALPKSLENVVPKEFRYWEHKGEKARAVRDALVAAKIFRTDDLKLVNGEIRLTTAKRYLTTTVKTDRPTTTAATLGNLLPKGRNYLHPFLTPDWRSCIQRGQSEPNALFVLSAPRRIALADLLDAAKLIDKADWLIEVDDSPEARDVLMELGRPFKIAASEDKLFAASFPIEKHGVEWCDIPAEVWKEPRTVSFALSWQHWRGNSVVRSAPSRQVWHLLLDDPRGGLKSWVLTRDPLSGGNISGVLTPRSSKALLSFAGDVKPGERIGGDVLNDTKNTPSKIGTQDSGKAIILEEGKNFLSIDFKGGKLKGVHHLVAEEVGSKLWQFGEGAQPARDIPKLAKAHTVTDYKLGDGTLFSNVQVWNPSKMRDTDDKGGARDELKPLALFKPMKAPNRPTNVFSEYAEALKQFAGPQAFEDGVVVEPKWNGFRVTLQKDARGKMLMLTEEVFDRGQPMPNMLASMKGLAAEAAKLPGPYILDAEFMAERDGHMIPRRELAAFRSGKPVDDAGVRLCVFRALYLDGKNLTSQSEEENHRALVKFLPKDLKHIKLTPRKIARTPAALRDALQWASRFDGSEGAMLKRSSATYSLGGENDLWAKLKVQREIRAIVYRKQAVQGSPGVFTFYCAVGPVGDASKWRETVKVDGKEYTPIGRTFNSRAKADVGSVLRVNTTELLVDQAGEKAAVSWFTPVVVDVADAAPHKPADIKRLATPAEMKKTSAILHDIPILKADEERYVLGIVLEPNDGKAGAPLDPDAQSDVYSAEEIREAAHKFLADFRNLGLQHKEFISGAAKVVESYISPTDFSIGGVKIRRGTWLLAVKVVDDALWNAVKSGKLTGFSIGGSAVRKPVQAA